MKCLIPSSVLIYPIPSTISYRVCSRILIYFFLLYQIGIDKIAYVQSEICHLGTTYMCDYFVEGCVPYLVSLEKYFQAYYPYSLLLFQAKNGTP